MAIPDDLSVALARLGMLGHSQDVEIRPVLLRVVVDLFLQRQHHAPDDLRTFEAMVVPLLEDVSEATRRVLVDRLFDHPATPRALLDRLMDDESLIAAEVYRHASFDESALLAAADHGSGLIAATIAQRPGLPPAVVHALVNRPEARIGIAVVDNPEIVLTPGDVQTLVQRACSERNLAERLASRSIDPLAIAPLFPLVSPPQRRRIIEAVRRSDLGRRQWGRTDAAAAATLTRLDRLIAAGEWESFDYALCAVLGCDHRVLRPLLHDGTGDILALGLAAAGVTPEIAARAFILGEPAIGRSVTAVRRLTALVETIAPAAARRLINAMIDSGKPEPRRPVHAPLPGSRRAEALPAESSTRRDPVEQPRRVRG